MWEAATERRRVGVTRTGGAGARVMRTRAEPALPPRGPGSWPRRPQAGK